MLGFSLVAGIPTPPARAFRFGAPAVAAVALLLFATPPTSAETDPNRQPPEPAGGEITAPTPEPAVSAGQQRLRQRIERVWATGYLKPGTTAIYVVDAQSGEPLYAVHPDAPLNPASNVKLVSTATVLDILGPEFRYATRLYGVTPDREGTIPGGVYLRGEHDPTLSARSLHSLARALRANGVTRIRGDVWLSDDATRDTLGSSQITVTVRGSSRVGRAAEVSVSPASPFIRVVNRARTGRGRRSRLGATTQVIDDGTGTRLVVRVSGRVGRNRTARLKRAALRPSSLTAHTLAAALQSAGITVEGSIRIGGFDEFVGIAADEGLLPVELARTESAPASALIAQINKRSLNFLSDRLVMSAGAAAFGGEPNMANAVKAMDRFLTSADLAPDECHLDTGSGLSYKTELSARQIVRVLRVAAGYAPRDEDGEEHAEVYRESLAVGGVDGTLRARFRGSLRGRVFAKTGTLTGIIALSGFVEHEDQTLAFAIVSNGTNHRRRKQVRRQHEQIVELLAGFMAKRGRPVAGGAVGSTTATAATR